MTRVSTDDLRAMLTDPNPDIRWKARMLVLLPLAGSREEGARAQQELDALYADPDPAVRRRADDLRHLWLEEELSDHLQVVLEVLADDTAVDGWPGCAELLRLAVPGYQFEFDFLVTVLAKTTSEGLAERLAAALGLPAGRDLPRFTTAQAGEGACVVCRSCTPDATGPEGGDDASHAVATARCARVSALVALLGSRLDPVCQGAVHALAELGPGVTGVLRTARQSRTLARRGAPAASLRRGALVALAEIDWHELDPADRSLLERFIRTCQRTETPVALGPRFEWDAEWYAVQTTDQAAVLDAFDLCDPVPATMRMGLAAWSREDGWRPGNRSAYGERTPTFEQVYVTPALDGWMLVFAHYPSLDGGGPPARARAADAQHRCWQLSRRFGAAHWYAQSLDGYNDHSGWCVYEHGDVVRYCYYHPTFFDLPDGQILVGPTDLADLGVTSPLDDLRAWLTDRTTSTSHPPPQPPAQPALTRQEAEARLRRAVFGPEVDDLDDLDYLDEEPVENSGGTSDDWEFSVSEVAWRLSVSPESFGPDLRVEGTGVLAVPRALRDRPRYGALPV